MPTRTPAGSSEMRAAARHGVTLIELVVVLAVVAVLAAVATPSLREFMMQQRLKSAAAELLADVQLARSTSLGLSLQLSSWVVVDFRSDANMTCYSLAVVKDDETVCDCRRTQDICRRGATPKDPPFRVASVDRSIGITVAAPSLMYFSSSGMPTDRLARTLTVTASDGRTLNVIVGATGFPRLCAPAGTNVSGVPSCS